MAISPLLSLEEVRQLLGLLAEGKTDAEITEIRDEFAAAAQAVLPILERRAAAAAERSAR